MGVEAPLRAAAGDGDTPAGGARRNALENAARWLAVASCAALPLPIATLSICTGLFAVAWLLSGLQAGNFAMRWRRIRTHPVARAALALFAWIAVAMLWSPAPWRASVDAWWHYRGLLLLAVALSIVEEPAWRWRAIVAFLGGFALALAVSYLRRLGVLPLYDHGGRYSGFCGHAGFSLMLALVAYTMLWLWRVRPRQRAIWVVYGIAALFNLYFINDGRTGQVAFLALLPLAAVHLFSMRGLAFGAIAAVVLAVGVYETAPRFRQRMDQSASDIRGFEERGDPLTVEGQRLSFIRNTRTLILSHPWLGGGTGSFIYEYARLGPRLDPPNSLVTHNPHNDYLMIWSQQGLPGLALLFWLWASQWRYASRKPEAPRYLTYGLMLLIAIGGLVNSFLLDTLESHIYALLTVAFGDAWPRSDSSA
ncbi:MAG TPA: O-antigen ligase family protein [Burkholderiaceae bacterium]|nr:O-antigen ligase family protein [Burkholderiaceae bacterium]